MHPSQPTEEPVNTKCDHFHTNADHRCTALMPSRCVYRSIEAEASCVGYANRAMARLKAGDAAAAEQDCSSALELDATYLKAWLRRSSARKLLGRRLEAIDDLEQALRWLTDFAARLQSNCCYVRKTIVLLPH